MRIKYLKGVILALILAASINEKFYAATYVEGIQWVTSYDEGLKQANENDKNMFVLITAPSWCYYCRLFEKDILVNKKIQKFLNENYVSVLVLDQIDGKRNPDLSRFVFPGFPSIYIYNKLGDLVKNISTRNPNEMMSFLKKYSDITVSDVTADEARNNGGNNIEGEGLTPEAEDAISSFMDTWVRK